MKNEWHNAITYDVPPTHQTSPCEKWSSVPVLVVLSDGTMLVATLEHWEELDNPKWYSNCSEHWELYNVVCWQYLPKSPI